MNLCLKCSSLYSEPGTCNCYADPNTQPVRVPTQPVIPTTPTYPYFAPWPTPTVPDEPYRWTVGDNTWRPTIVNNN